MNLDPGGPKTYGSGSATLIITYTYVYVRLSIVVIWTKEGKNDPQKHKNIRIRRIWIRNTAAKSINQAAMAPRFPVIREFEYAGKCGVQPLRPGEAGPSSPVLIVQPVHRKQNKKQNRKQM